MYVEYDPENKYLKDSDILILRYSYQIVELDTSTTLLHWQDLVFHSARREFYSK